MTKTHHPHSREERIKLKKNAQILRTKPTHAKKRFKEKLKDRETYDELSRAARLHEYETD